jgi:hypothetical protein
MFTLDQVVPWGRSFEEYCRMFALLGRSAFTDSWVRGRSSELQRRSDGDGTLNDLLRSAIPLLGSDFDEGKRQGRYVDAELPTLPFADHDFDLALCSHFLSLYTEQFSEDFHVTAIQEMCRVAEEVRVFPLLALGGSPSRHVESVSDRLRVAGCSVLVERVPYEFQRGGNRMMRINRKSR